MTDLLSAHSTATKSSWSNRFWRLGEAGQTAEEAPRIRAIRMSIVGQNTPWMMAANIGNAALAAIAFWGSPSSLAVNLICAMLITIAITTAFKWWKSRSRAPREQASERGTRKAVLHAAILSGLWASLAIVAYADATETQRMVLIALTVGMAGGGGFALATVPPASVVFCGIVGLGAAIALGSNASVVGFYLFSLYAIFAAIIVRSSLAVCESLTEKVRAKMAADEQRDVIGLLLNDFEQNTADWLWGADENLRLERASSRFCEKLAAPDSLIVGKPIIDAIPFAMHFMTEIEQIEDRESFRRKLEARQSFRDVDICVEQGGELGIWSLTAKAIHDESGRFIGYRGVGRDVTTNRQTRLRIEHMARHDPLTDVGNRVLLNEDLARAVSRLERHGDGFSLLLLDLDRFKQVNDNHGHAGGDELLREVAGLLQQLCSEGDTLARLGGDEFVILHMSGEDPKSAGHLATRIIKRLGQPFHLRSGTAHIGVSIGLACAPVDGTDPDQLIRNADLALYRAKADGRNRFRYFDSSLDATARRRNLIEQELALAVSLSTLELYFQPLIDAQSHQVVCAEALLRWNHTRLGPISPAEFIPIAEETGLITSIGAWVLREACRVSANWPDDVRVAVNLSSRQFLSPGLVPMVENALKANAMRPGRLELEVTESLLMNSTPAVEQTLKTLSKLGIRIALDDFGTGFSSLSYLRRFRFDKLKIDQSFISDMETNEDGRAIVECVIRLAKDLRMSVAAEGVETQNQLVALRQLGCGEIQGYLVSRPMPADAFAAFLRAGAGGSERRYA
ncbi:diguanylate cyclase [Rhizobium sp. Root274]|uniref:putative bifunctional diguanylate cyclase/phosphodiesterase n=1 Tax=unclassified Rhizobium TaxID=2613769 RepID=UPI0007161A3A|nr:MULTISPECIES: EAL domain-containing protein [unclassified Rhizobium]KQW28798.1 diguanylate cyclase [Rhizobium sp. Root1240]KRD28994.1 diguanylate cyclase [Rhizobium sp. Root274]